MIHREVITSSHSHDGSIPTLQVEKLHAPMPPGPFEPRAWHGIARVTRTADDMTPVPREWTLIGNVFFRSR